MFSKKMASQIILSTLVALPILMLFQNCNQFTSQLDPSGATQTSSGAQDTDLNSESLNDYYNVKSFGAKGDGSTVDRVAIQNAIDQAAAAGGGVIYFPAGIYLVDVVGSSDGGIISLSLKSRVTLKGASQQASILKLKDASYGPGAYYRLIASDHNGQSSHMAIRDLTIDGNSSHQSVSGKQASNILLEADGSEDIVIDSIRSINSGGQGIQVRGSSSQFAQNIRITNNLSENHLGICIQASQFDGLVVTGNISRNCGDNGIDVYGDDGTNDTHARNFTITQNIIDTALVGVFNETVSSGVVSANTIANTEIGITVNRIHGEPKDININGNMITMVHNSGIRVTGDTGGIVISGNSISRFVNSAIELNNTATVDVINNFVTVADPHIPLILLSGPHVYFSAIRGVEYTLYPVNIDPSKVVVVTAVQTYQNTISP
jgi:hypothetical protein